MKFRNLLSIMMILMMTMLACSCATNSSNVIATQVDNATTTTVETSIETTTKASTEEIETTEADTIEDTTEDKVEETNETTESAEKVATNDNKTLVAYFSATGTTKRVAEKIAELENADIYEIVPANPYSSDDLNWNDNNSRSTKEMDDKNVRPEIASDDIEVSNYSTIYLGYPIWWGDAPRIMSTFVEKYNFDGIKVIPFCTSGGSGIGRSGSNLADLATTGNWAQGERLNSSADTNNIQNFINNNK